MSFNNGELFRIEMRSGIYQVLAKCEVKGAENQYYFRKVFDDKLNLKVTKADLVHESWMRPLSQNVQDKLAEVIKDPAIKKVLDDLTIERAMQYGTRGTEHFSSMIWFSMNPKSKKNIEKQINGAIQGFIDFDWLRTTVKELEDRGDLIPNEACSAPLGDLRLYRLELGRYVDDFDDAGNECYREIRFYEMKL